ncbi:exported hypothetical protein [uncultured spirochete]|uniref:Uncharacterized protein n=1 Tax=uncultured spirochete TaxID=156406 RepID=A0A3P3XP26_9SPIR|nr:exported hypothetical protein [uncultured spirochete]
MRKFLLCLSIFISMVQVPSYTQSTDTVDAFTTEEFVLNDRHFSVNVDHFNTCLLVMLSYYYPEQFSLTDTEVKSLIDGYVRGKDVGHRFVFNTNQKAALGAMLDPYTLESTTVNRVLKFSFSKASNMVGLTIDLRQEGFEIPPDAYASISLFYDENSDAVHRFERDVISIVKRRISPLVEFLDKEKQYNFLPHKPLSLYVTFANNIQSLHGMANDYAQNAVMAYSLASEHDDAVLFFHELAHLWASVNEVKANIISEVEKSDKKEKYEEILKDCAGKIVQDDELLSKGSIQSESIVDIVNSIYDASLLGFNEFWAITASKYLFPLYSPAFSESACRFPAGLSGDKITWEHARDLFDWISATNYLDVVRLTADPQKVIYREFVLFVLCIGHGLDYALEKSGEFVQ